MPSPDPPPTPLLAFFLRYPNPFARHVLSVDVLSRRVDPITGQIHTTRLILKRGILPKWATRWLPSSATSGGRGLDAWVLEESVVDPPGWGEGKNLQGEDGEYGRQPRLRVQQGNLNHRKLMHVIEGGELRAGPNGLAKACPSSCHCFGIDSPFQKQQNLNFTHHLPPGSMRVGRIYQKLDHHKGKKDHQEAFFCHQEVWQRGQERSVQMGKKAHQSGKADVQAQSHLVGDSPGEYVLHVHELRSRQSSEGEKFVAQNRVQVLAPWEVMYEWWRAAAAAVAKAADRRRSPATRKVGQIACCRHNLKRAPRTNNHNCRHLLGFGLFSLCQPTEQNVPQQPAGSFCRRARSCHA
ncbi:hypothetical protein I315_02725 [Cryptococcus gattii Ru294]|nr:hypothetical protein I315_02725 [Cryptococcus gattii Ru294]